MRTLLAVFITVIGLNLSNAQKEINGVIVLNTETFQEKELNLNGASNLYA